MGVFLAMNGWALKADSVGAIQAMMALAGGEIGKSQFAAWLKRNIKWG
ncbi:MAG TPA: hypothetical protein VJP60_06855 [Rhizomicrobium sp.]|nr:hypothetical protein [Rhizomicrobium sp.]